ncbi:hypothetical protein TIFTF001_054703 [Ficus carica]|uniref:Uncharacterized protein n=1 Tax=Ficus carica TaxID=3494 RepID=A0AA88JFQ9_FICCA|nr:hypothetical protein TIFTF001_054703 [Ficus carica]
MEATALLTLPLILFLSFTTNGVSTRHGSSVSEVNRRQVCLLVEWSKIEAVGSKLKKVSRWYDGVYKLVSSSGGDVGTSTKFDETRLLVLVDEPLPFQFVPFSRNVPSATK